MSRKGRPPKFVNDSNGRPIVGLSYCKSSDRYYATYSKPRKWFATKFKESLFQFQKYLSKQKENEEVVEIYVPQTTHTYQKTGEIEWVDIPDEPVVIPAAYEGDITSIPEILLLQKAREIILSDPIAAPQIYVYQNY